MLKLRLKALAEFLARPMQTWGPDLSKLDINDFHYYLKPVGEQQSSWEDVPQDIKTTFDRLGVPDAERKYLAGLGAQYESEVVYHRLKDQWAAKGVIFLNQIQN